ncbi:hypothetical protein [Sinorhizobium meliloti]|uniref:hypothetical protein n=1 Tax=Rhizobium meliloti TaxID=382 RepID=UPI00398CD61A
MPGFIHGFIHDSKHGTSAISNHPVPLLQMKSLSRGLNQQRKGGLFVALTTDLRIRRPSTAEYHSHSELSVSHNSNVNWLRRRVQAAFHQFEWMPLAFAASHRPAGYASGA